MHYIIHNIEKKLKKATINDKLYNPLVIENKIFLKNNNIFEAKNYIFFMIKKIVLNFIIFISKNLINKRRKKKNFMLFIKIYTYLNSFFLLDNKIHFFKKYFFKKNQDIFYPDKFFLSKKQINLKQCLVLLKEKKIAFYKKNIWLVKKKFRKKNILIFNKKFFKLYFSKRFNSFIVESLLPIFKIRKQKELRFLKKGLYGIFFRRYYYLFLHKKYIFNKRKKWQKKPFIINFSNRTHPKFFINKRLPVKYRWRGWCKLYYHRKGKTYFSRIIFCGLNSTAFNTLYSYRFNDKSPMENKEILSDYLVTYGSKLAKKYPKDKDFYKRFFSRKKFYRRNLNVIYYYKWKPKFFDFYLSNFFNLYKSMKSVSRSLIWFRLFFKKIVWKTKKFQKKFILFFYKRFFFNKTTLFFNSILKDNLFFYNHKRIKRLFRFRKRRLFYYDKKKRRRFLKGKFVIKMLKLFILLLFFKFMKKNKNTEKAFILKNAFISKNLKKMDVSFLFSVLFGLQSFYFIGPSTFTDDFIIENKKDLKMISLLKKK